MIDLFDGVDALLDIIAELLFSPTFWKCLLAFIVGVALGAWIW